MFQLVELEDVVRITPDKFDEPLNEAAKKILKAKYESTVNPELGFVILVTDVKVDPVGKIIPGDGATYHKARLSILTFLPKIKEVIEGIVVEIMDFGAFVRIGPADALLHLSQILDEYLTTDARQGIIRGTQSNRTLRVGSVVRVRITAVSLGKGMEMGKIGVTCRQPFLGALEWIEEDVKKAEMKKAAR